MADTALNNQVPAKVDASGASKKPFPGLGFLDNLAEMPILRQVGLMVGLAASVALGFAVVLWSQQPDYRPLYGSMSGLDANQVVEALTSADINYKVDPNTGALLVKADDLGRARLKMASAGVAPTDGIVGFELLDKEQPLGTSQFMEAANYRRGLEGELSRTIASLNGIKSARVHLAIPKSSVFVRDERKPTASVLVELYPGRTLETGQVMAIVNLVATSVPELTKSQVTVVDQKGQLLSDQLNQSEFSVAGKQLDYTNRIESTLTQRVQNMMQPIVGNGRFKAEVSADVDFNAVESTSEQFNPDQPALRSEQINTEQRQTAGGGPQGVPGALSNQPPGPATAPENATAAAGTNFTAPGQLIRDPNDQFITDPKTGLPATVPYPTDKRDQSTRNYELDRSISYTRQQQGRVRRLSVAVVLDDQVKLDAATGQVSHTPWSADDLARFTRLVQDAVGFDASRGDSVSVINAPFAPIAADDVESIPFYSQPWFWDVVKQGLGVLFILVLVFGVLRPVLNNLAGTNKSKDLALADGMGGAGDLAGSGAGGLSGGDLADDKVSLASPAALMLPGPSENYEVQLNAIKQLVTEDPGLVAQVVRDWINADE
ncbi:MULTISPECIES: flagellar basal-body MS-ring/collar protein FliF [Pseudomonas]|uniref:Flagellar M-ring protein n=1 Tax=Pseudomonas luteola TaxID=47886 RepID=A0ABS0FJF4_PSELU|nr:MULTISPECIES: flagellar basal-body MS-ring/collar protein FliF [Pseudomonas]MBF8640478.1 flagellar M-ring protein FliF [Pseudomonas zeshuii]RRW49405.1 flagellar basal body M-ring protein FliF [Pseudomonas luteola]SHI70582.1 flagellar M-ring protein FliF [Pseudomonas zeshuii]